MMKRALFALTLGSTLAVLPCAAAEIGTAFTSENPKIMIDLPPSIHSSGGIRSVIQNDAIVGRIARPLKEDEREFGLRVVPVFLQPRVFFAHPSAKVRSLTTGQLVGIFSGTIKNWSEVGGPDLRVRVVRREEADSSLAVFRDTLPGWKELQFDRHRSKLAVTTQDAFETVKQYEGAIGFGPYNSKLDERLTVLRVNGISPMDPSYPSVIALSLIYRDATVTEAARAFIDFVFTEKAQNVVREFGGIPVRSRQELM